MHIWMGIHTSGPILRDVSALHLDEELAGDDRPLGDDLRWKFGNEESDTPDSFAEVLLYVSLCKDMGGCGAVQLT
jgi:hypothetical protein